MNELFGYGMYGSYHAMPKGISKCGDDLSIEAAEMAIVRAIVCESYADMKMLNEGYDEADKIMYWIEGQADEHFMG